MASTWEDLLQLELQATGENSTTWGTRTNDNFERLADAIAGHESIDVAGSGDYTINQSTAVGATFRKAFLTLTGLLTGARVIVIPASAKTYYIRNATTGGFGITVKTAAGVAATLSETGVTIVVCDGTDCYAGVNAVARSGDSMTGKLTITSGGLAVDNKVCVSGTAYFGSTVSVSADLIIGATLSVIGAASFGSTVSVSGIATFKSAISVSGIATFGRTVSVSGAATFGSTVSVGGALVVTGAGTFGSTVSVSGAMVVTGAADFKSNVSVSANLVVGGLATFGSTVSVSSGLVVKGAVSVGGAAIFGASVDFKSNVSISAGIVVGGNVQVVGTVSATGTINAAGGLLNNGAGVPPIPKSGSGNGQFVRLNSGTGSALALPADGTWIYAINSFTAVSGAWAADAAGGPTAGGTTIANATSGVVHVGWAWRVTA